MPDTLLISCHGWSVNVGELVESVQSGRGGFGAHNAIASLPRPGALNLENPHRMAVEADLRRLGTPGADGCFSPRGVGRLAALCFPTASREPLRICTMSMVLALMFDDVLEQRDAAREDVLALAHRLKATLAGNLTCGVGNQPLVRLAHEIHASLGALGPGRAWRARFSGAFDRFVDTAVRTHERWRQGACMVNLSDYLRERYHDIGVAPMLALTEVASGQVLDERTYHHPDIVALRDSCIFYMALVNDVFSYHREVIQAGNPTNAVAVVQMQLRLSFARAVTAVVLMARRCYGELEARARQLLSAPELSPAARRHVESMVVWVAGALQWSLESERYRHPASPLPELRRPVVQLQRGDSAAPGGHGAGVEWLARALGIS